MPGEKGRVLFRDLSSGLSFVAALLGTVALGQLAAAVRQVAGRKRRVVAQESTRVFLLVAGNFPAG